MTNICFAYYCSGHGLGHATRVSAFACHLLSLAPPPTVHIVSSAPKHAFRDSIVLGAHYRYSEIDPVIVQPLAYRVDRQKSVDVLKDFLDKKDTKLQQERAWLVETKVDCVLSDAAFLGCLAANAAGLPSVLVTNFTFDSVYSYLSAPLADDNLSAFPEKSDDCHLHPPNAIILPDLIPDIPIPQSILNPLVEQIHAGFRCADLLMLLPGSIPIPSFSASPSLPSSDWIDWKHGGFKDDVARHLTESNYEDSNAHGKLHDVIPFAASSKPKTIPRRIIRAPLLVRLPTSSSRPSSKFPSLSPYTSAGRRSLLASIGIPAHLHDQGNAKILVVSFGGQVFRRVGSRNGSRSASRGGSPLRPGSTIPLPDDTPYSNSSKDIRKITLVNLVHPSPRSSPPPSASTPSTATAESNTPYRHSGADGIISLPNNPPLATHSHIFIPGAPPASKPLGTPVSPTSKIAFQEIPPSQPGTPPCDNLNSNEAESIWTSSKGSYFDPRPDEGLQEENTQSCGLLPDETWIAIVCGVSKEQWNGDVDGDDGLPDGFYVAPEDVYMPDLTAIADVLLGKLGYGTVSECVDSSTPLVYVSRPLFIEEHGLRLLLSQSGVGVELPRAAYEAGGWAEAIEDAWMKGQERKRVRSILGDVGGKRRDEEGREMARQVVRWVEEWQGFDSG